MKTHPNNNSINSLMTLAAVWWLSIGSLAHCATLTWTNTASGNWGNAANWNPNQVPGATDTAVITGAGVTVTLDISPTVGGIILGDSGAGMVTLAPNNQTLSVNGPLTINPSGSFTLDSGTLSGNLTISGILKWTGGVFGLGNNGLTIATNGAVILAGTNGGNYPLSENVTNAGTLRITGGNLQIQYCGSSGWGNLINLPGALVDMAADSSIFNSCGGPGFVNGGTVRKSGGTGTNVITVSPFTSFGTVDAQTGTISLQWRRHLSRHSVAEPGCQPTFKQRNVHPCGNLISSNAVLAGATLSGNGTISGVLNWTDGTFGFQNYALTIATNGTVVLAGTNGGTYLIAQNVTNAGTLRVQGGNLQIAWIGGGQYGQFHNLPGALVDLATDGPFGPDSGSPGFFNAGTLRKSGGTGTNNITGNVVNTGTVDAQTGTISLANGGSLAGILVAEPGANLLLSSGTFTLAGNLISSNAVLSGATLSGNGTISGVLNWTDGTFGFQNNALTIATNGTVVLAGTNGGTYLIAQNVTNAGTLRVQGGNLQIAWIGGGQYGQFYNLPGALVDLATDGPFGPDSESPGFFNAGTLRKSGGIGTNNITGNVVNTGTVDAQTGTITFESFANSASKLLVANGATIKIPQAVALPVLVTGSGTVQAPSITSSGVVNPGATNAVLNLVGNYTQLLGGSIQFDIGGTAPGVNQSQVNVTGSANLNGLIALRFSPGYVPAVNRSNLVLTAGSRTGHFPFQDHFYLLGHNERIISVYGPTNLVLTAIAAADPTNFSLSTAVQGPTFVLAWPSEFGSYELEVKTNLDRSNLGDHSPASPIFIPKRP